MAIMPIPVIRPANVVVLLKLEASEATDANPSAAVDAIPVEASSVTFNTPWATEASTEASGSLVGGAPLIIGRPATISFKSQVKGAGAGVAYTSTVKPPLHQALQACGKRGQFTAAIATSLATGGGFAHAVLGDGYGTTPEMYRGMRAVITAGANAGYSAMIWSYSAAKIASLACDNLPVANDATSSIAIPANWTYSGTSPADVTARATDQPSGTIYVYRDGVLYKFVGCRGTVNLNGSTAKPGFAEFSFSGIFAGSVDAAMPSGLVLASHSGPVLAQGANGVDRAALLNRVPMPISQWSLENGGDLETPDDPNTAYGFGGGIIADRTPLLKMDPLSTLKAYRDSVSEIGAGTLMTAALLLGRTSGNRWAITIPRCQKTAADDGTRGKLGSEQITAQVRSLIVDAYARDGDSIITFD